MIKALLISASLILSSLSFAEELSGAAPDFTLKSNSGENYRLSEHRGEVLLINFWASWCGPCRQEMPLLDGLHNKYSKLGFSVLGVNVDEDSSMADNILNDIPVTFPILYDESSDISSLYNVDAMPTTIMVDRDGNMRVLHRGYKPGYEDLYEKDIKMLVRE